VKQKNLNQWSITKIDLNDSLLEWIEAFLVDRKAQNMSAGTVYFYQKKMELFYQFCEGRIITQIGQLTPSILREYLFWLESKGHNPGGVNACYRAIKTFLRWFENEVEPEGWSNPIRKVKQPKIAIDPLEPVSRETIQSLLKQCSRNTFYGTRDYAIILFLFDTGARASELCSVNFEDYNQISGEVLIRQGKGRKPRRVYLGKKARRAMRAYFKVRPENKAMFITQYGERLSYWGLNQVIGRLAKRGGIDKPELHAFRRAFALNMLRAGVDIHSLAALMGHADLQVLSRYLKQSGDDLKKAHQKGSPVDNL